MTQALLDIKDLTVSFHNNEEDFTAVNNISFHLNKGEILGIVGESGSGKSLTALSILGLLPFPKAYHSPESSIKFNGAELINNPDLRSFRGSKIGFIFQEPMSSLNPLHNIEKQISETLIVHQNLSSKEARKQTLRLLKMTGIKNARQRLKSYPHELSGGQRQRVMIAMAIANNPDILIADEPTTALDATIQTQIIDLIIKLKNNLSMSVIFITHDLNLIRRIADRIIVMKSGRIIETNLTEKLFAHPEKDYTKKLISSYSILKNNKIGFGEEILTVNDLTVTYPIEKNFWGKVSKTINAVNKVSLKLHKGQTLGIVGESGSGKTTLGKAISKLIPYQGEITLNLPFDNNRQYRKLIQIVFQDPYNSLNPRMTIEQIVGEGLDIHFKNLNKNTRKQKIIETIEEVGLTKNDLNKYPHEFSGGQRQRIAIARAIILEPELIILDEPTSALDVTIQAQILSLLQKIQNDRQISYIFISHDLNAVQALSDVIAVMQDGKIIEMNEREQLFENPIHTYTKKLISAYC